MSDLVHAADATAAVPKPVDPRAPDAGDDQHQLQAAAADVQQPPVETSASRICKLPVVEQSLSGASAIYGKVKESSSIVGWTLDKAESAIGKAAEVATPVTSCLEKPLKTFDTIISKSLDFVESKVPAVKMPPQEMLTSTKQYLAEKVQPAVKCACAVKDCACAVKDYGAKKLTSLTSHDQSAEQSPSKEDERKQPE